MRMPSAEKSRNEQEGKKINLTTQWIAQVEHTSGLDVSSSRGRQEHRHCASEASPLYMGPRIVLCAGE